MHVPVIKKNQEFNNSPNDSPGVHSKTSAKKQLHKHKLAHAQSTSSSKFALMFLACVRELLKTT